MKVVLQNDDYALNILMNQKNKKKDLGEVKIGPDRTPQQRALFSKILSNLELAKQNGDTNKRLKYINGIPTIIDVSEKKNTDPQNSQEN